MYSSSNNCTTPNGVVSQSDSTQTWDVSVFKYLFRCVHFSYFNHSTIPSRLCYMLYHVASISIRHIHVYNGRFQRKVYKHVFFRVEFKQAFTIFSFRPWIVHILALHDLKVPWLIFKNKGRAYDSVCDHKTSVTYEYHHNAFITAKSFSLKDRFHSKSCF